MGLDLNGRDCGEALGGVEGREAVIRVLKKLFQLKMKKKAP